MRLDRHVTNSHSGLVIGSRLRRDYGLPDILINENGVPDDVTDSGDAMADQRGGELFHQHLRVLHQAIGGNDP